MGRRHGPGITAWPLMAPGIGRSRGGLSTKIHTLGDGSGLPLVIEVTPARLAIRAHLHERCIRSVIPEPAGQHGTGNDADLAAVDRSGMTGTTSVVATSSSGASVTSSPGENSLHAPSGSPWSTERTLS